LSSVVVPGSLGNGLGTHGGGTLRTSNPVIIDDAPRQIPVLAEPLFVL
jgi:hypothetical protein